MRTPKRVSFYWRKRPPDQSPKHLKSHRK